MSKAALFEIRGDRPLALHAAAIGIAFPAPTQDEGFELSGSTAIVTIRGPLVQHGGVVFWDNYDSIRARVAAACAKEDVTDVVLRIDSPGGDALGCFECGRELRASAKASGKKLWAYCDGMIASAAFAIAVSATAGIYVPLAGAIGSVGVMRAVVDATAADAAQGLKYAVVSSGIRKLDGNPHVSLTEDALKAVQANVDELADLFFSFVEELRPQTSASILKGLEGAILFGQSAVKAGLADGIAEWTEFLAMVAKDEGASAPGATATDTETQMDKKEMRAWLKSLSEDKDEKVASKAKAALKCLEDDGDGDEKKEAKAAAEDKKEEAKAEEPADKKDEKKEEAKAASNPLETKSAAASPDLALLARVHALETERANEKEEIARTTLLAKRPDFSAEVRASLSKRSADGKGWAYSLAQLTEAVETWPSPQGFPAAAVAVTGTRGAPHGDQPVIGLAREDAELIASAMGEPKASSGIVRSGRSLELGFIAPEDLNKKLAAMNAGKDKVS